MVDPPRLGSAFSVRPAIRFRGVPVRFLSALHETHLFQMRVRVATKKGRESGPVRLSQQALVPNGSGNPAASRRDAIQPENEDRAEGRADEACGLTRPVEVKRLADESADESADDSENDGHQDSTRIVPGHDELRDDPDDEAE
jgi:hypothetical protein